MAFVKLLFLYLLELANNFGEGNTGANSHEIKVNKVNAASRLDVNISSKLVTINNFWCIVCCVTNYLN
jgi:hypothetical protein